MLKRPYRSDPARWERVLRRHVRRPLRPEAARSALLVVDMQRLFTDPGGPAHLPASRKALSETEALLAAFRCAGRPAAFCRYVSSASGPMARWWRRRVPASSPWSALAPELMRRKREPVFLKRGYSAFRGTGLERWLKARKVRDLVIAGVMTHLCVASTARDAFDLGWRVFVPMDACASSDEVLHLAALRTLGSGFAYILRTRSMLESV